MKSYRTKTKMIIAILSVIGIVGGYLGYRYITRDPYKAYTAITTNTKQAGTMEHVTKEEETWYLSSYYPKFDIKKLDEAIQSYQENEIETDLKQNRKIIILVDYDSQEIYDTYISIAFHQKLMDQHGKELKTTTTTINYDKKRDRLMSHEDVLRRDYLSILKVIANKEKLDPNAITGDTLDTFVLDDNEVTFYLHHDVTRAIALPYIDYSTYIALTNENIPSLYQKDPVTSTVKDENIDPNQPMVAFTFDDGPSELTLQLMDAFDQYDANATFFVIGSRAEQHPDIVKEIAQRGFELGNHTWSHEKELTQMSDTQLHQEIYDTQDAIFQATGKDPIFLRPPYGSYDDNVLEASSMSIAYWGVDSQDWRSRNVKAIKKEILSQVFDGAIILEHDIYDTSVEATIELLPELKAKGYQIVGLNTLMNYRGETLKKNQYLVASQYR